MIAASIAILSSAAVVSTGFAAWVISGGDTNSDVSGTITADTVTDEIHKITITNQTNNEVYFGAPEGEQNDKAWLKNNGSKKEKLKPSITFTVAGLEAEIKEPNKLFKSISLAEKTETAEANKYSTAIAKKVVDILPKITIGATFDTSVEDASKIYLASNSFADNTQTFTVTMVFGWGFEFGKTNPYKYYSDKTYTKELASSAETLLKYVEAINTSFTLTIETL